MIIKELKIIFSGVFLLFIPLQSHSGEGESGIQHEINETINQPVATVVEKTFSAAKDSYELFDDIREDNIKLKIDKVTKKLIDSNKSASIASSSSSLFSSITATIGAGLKISGEYNNNNSLKNMGDDLDDLASVIDNSGKVANAVSNLYGDKIDKKINKNIARTKMKVDKKIKKKERKLHSLNKKINKMKRRLVSNRKLKKSVSKRKLKKVIGVNQRKLEKNIAKEQRKVDRVLHKISRLQSQKKALNKVIFDGKKFIGNKTDAVMKGLGTVGAVKNTVDVWTDKNANKYEKIGTTVIEAISASNLPVASQIAGLASAILSDTRKLYNAVDVESDKLSRQLDKLQNKLSKLNSLSIKLKKEIDRSNLNKLDKAKILSSVLSQLYKVADASGQLSNKIHAQYLKTISSNGMFGYAFSKVAGVEDIYKNLSETAQSIRKSSLYSFERFKKDDSVKKLLSYLKDYNEKQALLAHDSVEQLQLCTRAIKSDVSVDPLNNFSMITLSRINVPNLNTIPDVIEKNIMTYQLSNINNMIKTQVSTEKSIYTSGFILKTPVDIVLSWGEFPSDLDSHLTGPDGIGGRFHVAWYRRGNANAQPYVKLFTDYTNHRPNGANLPEQIRVYKLNDGIYRYYIHNYSEWAGIDALSRSGAVVRLHNAGGFSTDEGVGLGKVVAEFKIPKDKSGYYVHVFDLNSRTNVVNKVMEFSNTNNIR